MQKDKFCASTLKIRLPDLLLNGMLLTHFREMIKWREMVTKFNDGG
jgi:hypothetical protein